jgi:hypothetical protein
MDGSDLSDLTFATDSTTYEYSYLLLFDSGTGGDTFWICYSKGPKLASRGLPHLPSKVGIFDITGVSPEGLPVSANMGVRHREGASATPWTDLGRNEVSVVLISGALAATGR